MKAFRKGLGIICLLEAVFGIYLSFTTLKDRFFIGIVVCAIFGLFAFLLLRNTGKPKESNFNLDTPKETLKEIKTIRQSVHTDRIIQVIQKSYAMCLDTNNLSTFESRLETATKNAYTLKEFEQSGLYNCEPSSDYFLNLLIGERQKLLDQFLLRAYAYTLNKVKSELKTESGVKKRIEKFLTEVEESVLDFDISILPK